MLKIAFYNRKVAKQKNFYTASFRLCSLKKFSKEPTVEECDATGVH